MYEHETFRNFFPKQVVFFLFLSLLECPINCGENMLQFLPDSRRLFFQNDFEKAYLIDTLRENSFVFYFTHCFFNMPHLLKVSSQDRYSESQKFKF